ncbi:hypothetical protein JCM19233_4229 [Vibrio astriarenae]|nr:hypothetical protein JCM19233_4229 [Vibrio sp. C7]
MNKCSLLSLSILAALTGCGSDSDSAPVDMTYTLSGKLDVSEIQDIVYLDLNADGRLSQQEPQSEVNSDGSFELTLTEEQHSKLPISALKTTMSLATYEATEGSPLVYSALVDNAKGEAFINVFTTKVVDSLEDELELAASGDLDEEVIAAKKVQSEQEVVAEAEILLGEQVDADELFGDISGSDNTELAELAEAQEEKLEAIEEEKQQRRDELGLKDNQKIELDVRLVSHLEYYTDDLIYLREEEEVITTFHEDGSETREGKLTQWKLKSLASNCSEVIDGNNYQFIAQPLTWKS